MAQFRFKFSFLVGCVLLNMFGFCSSVYIIYKSISSWIYRNTTKQHLFDINDTDLLI